MPNNPPGITFLPTADAADQGLQRQRVEGDLGQAFKILSLRLPRVLGAKSIAPPNLLTSPGSAGMAGSTGGFNPYEQVFRAMLAGMQPGGSRIQPPGAGPMIPGAPGPMMPPSAPPPPLVTPGQDPGFTPEPLPSFPGEHTRGDAPVIGRATRRPRF